jgi:hypothetical protein
MNTTRLSPEGERVLEAVHKLRDRIGEAESRHHNVSLSTEDARLLLDAASGMPIDCSPKSDKLHARMAALEALAEKVGAFCAVLSVVRDTLKPTSAAVRMIEAYEALAATEPWEGQ